jgi:hypothetical protein
MIERTRQVRVGDVYAFELVSGRLGASQVVAQNEEGVELVSLDAIWEGLPTIAEACRARPLHRFGHAFPVFESAVLAPNLARLLRHAAVGIESRLRDGNDQAIDVLGHVVSFRFRCRAQRTDATGGSRPRAWTKNQ